MIAITRAHALHDYEEAVRRVQGEPWVVGPDVAPVEEVLQSASGVLLTGGGDVDPVHYGAFPHASYSPAEPGRDWYEIELVEGALAANLPILAICRGIQVLNVARHGTLVQDIPTEVPSPLSHRLPIPPNQAVTPAHPIWVERDSLLGRLLGPHLDEEDAVVVNSRHHQAVRHLGAGLVVVATAPDGVVEAVEAPGHPFCLGVQWHPENFYRTGEFRELFEGFIRAADRK